MTTNPAPTLDVAEMLLLAYGLTPLERDVLERVVAGLPSRAIATELHITVSTVQDHLKSVFAKAGVAAAANWWRRFRTCEPATR
ncbi:LuxR C-terminal-related transcriptional regulator [Streptomyces tendae]|uniref:LuxR C-terminal-related transcriptional regulator n=1 Tax=Streptomyces tendae TaxID=1932 RepID=UPI0037119441